MSCNTCGLRKYAVNEARNFVGRLARKAAKTNNPSDIAKVNEAKAELDRQRKFQQDHERECEVMV
ncbi:hypothetical protein ACFWDN_13015 [Micromonospora chalcea]